MKEIELSAEEVIIERRHAEPLETAGTDVLESTDEETAIYVPIEDVVAEEQPQKPRSNWTQAMKILIYMMIGFILLWLCRDLVDAIYSTFH